MTTLPETAPADGQVVAPTGPNGHPGQWIAVGPRTRAQMAKVLEQSLAAVWLALLEQSGAGPDQPWELVIESAVLRPVRRE